MVYMPWALGSLAAIYACFAVALMHVLVYGIGGLINLANPGISPSETVMIWAAKT